MEKTLRDQIRDTGDLISGLMDSEYGINKLENARRGLKSDILLMIISNLILGAVCIGVMYLRFRVFGG